FLVRMGLNSGDVVVGKIGDDLRMDYTAQGHTVGLASRMEQLAEPGRVYMAEDTAKLVSGFFRSWRRDGLPRSSARAGDRRQRAGHRCGCAPRPRQESSLLRVRGALPGAWGHGLRGARSLPR